MTVKSGIVTCILLGTVIDWVSAVAIYRDIDFIKKSDRGGRQYNALPLYDDEYAPMSHGRYRESQSQWESAEWPKHRGGSRGRSDNSYDSEDERPYDWFFYNIYHTNGRFNHLYNGPGNDNHAGMVETGYKNKNRNSPPRILPRPESVLRGFSFPKPKAST